MTFLQELGESARNIVFGVLRDRALDTASDLVSEHGENPEYDRALVEMTCRLLGLPTDEHRYTVAHLIGVRPTGEHKSLVLNQRQQEAVGYALARAVESKDTARDDKDEAKALLSDHFPAWARSVRPDLPDTRRS